MTDDKPVIFRLKAAAFAVAILLLSGSIAPALARVIAVGPHRALKLPSEAAAVARDGDTIEIDTGTYRDCSIWRAAGLTIEAHGPSVTITGRPCFERGLFIVTGANTTIRGLTFEGAHGAEHNAAGILAEADNLTVENSRFVNNENGILAGGTAASRVRVSGSTFQGNGSCAGACAHGVYVGAPIALLEISGSRFLGTQTAHCVKSRARSTIVAHNEIGDGENGTSSYLIDIPNGGDVLIEHNDLQKGARSSNAEVAISIGEGTWRNPTGTLTVRDNRFVSALPDPTIFVRNATPTAAALSGNVLEGKVVPLSGPGSVAP
jgi:hypothetical protein